MSLETSLSTSSFHLVASFGRSAICLNEDSVSLILQSCLGGNAKNFNVFHLSGWMHGFSVSCKEVGFMVRNLKSFTCKSAIFFFHWSDGGPNWRKDYALWCQEEAQWTTVGAKKSYADVVRSKPPPKVKKSIFLQLKYQRNYQSNFKDCVPSFSSRGSSLSHRISLSVSFEFEFEYLE